MPAAWLESGTPPIVIIIVFAVLGSVIVVVVLPFVILVGVAVIVIVRVFQINRPVIIVIIELGIPRIRTPVLIRIHLKLIQ